MGAVSECLLVVLLIQYAAAYDGKYRGDGDACGPDDKWTCRSLAQCPVAQNELKTKRTPLTRVCSFARGVPIVCCPPDDPTDRQAVIPEQKPKQSISKIMCERYSKFVFSTKRNGRLGSNMQVDECGRIAQPTIVGGKNASLKEFPHMALIGYQLEEEIVYGCGGSLISERWVLSAAHCTHTSSFGKAEFARLGELDTSSDNDGARPVTLRIIEHINHEDWNGVQLYNDIALYKMESDVKLSSYIRPICLQVEHTIKSPSGLATGWGRTKLEGAGSPILQKVWLDLVNGTSCNSSYGIQFQIPQGIEEPKMLCTFGKGVKDTCQGDSGGPLQIPLTKPYCMYSQVGVTSFGIECASKFPGVYSRVSHYVPWIEKHVWPNAEV